MSVIQDQRRKVAYYVQLKTQLATGKSLHAVAVGRLGRTVCGIVLANKVKHKQDTLSIGDSALLCQRCSQYTVFRYVRYEK